MESKSVLIDRPDRSDARLPPEEAARIAAAAREYFDSITPTRYPKPSRSENEFSGELSATTTAATIKMIPELDKLRVLEKHQQKMVYIGGEVEEEYVETEYYKDLNGVDKQHHTTGTGFIEVEKSNDGDLDLLSVSTSSSCPISCKGNPATNEWIPSAEKVVLTSKKPNRSEA